MHSGPGIELRGGPPILTVCVPVNSKGHKSDGIPYDPSQ